MVYKPKVHRFYLVEFRFHGKRKLKRRKMTRIEDGRAIENAIHPQAEIVEKVFRKTAEGVPAKCPTAATESVRHIVMRSSKLVNQLVRGRIELPT